MAKFRKRELKGWQYKEVAEEEFIIKRISSELEIVRVLFLKNSNLPSDMEIRVPIKNNKDVINELKNNDWLKVGLDKTKDNNLIQIMRKEIKY